MRALPSELRRQLEAAVLAGRRAAESGVRAALSSLGVQEEDKPAHLDENRAQLRRGLRAKQRQLGGEFEVLLWECAYEQWHRLLFARFLAENGLLQHPEFGAPVTLAECEELAADLGEPDGWSVAGRFAAEILPGIFRLDDPCVQLRLAPEHRVALERVVAGLPREVFAADDSLGWVYQYWQKDRKDQVNASEVKIGGADLGPVTQLFTENYMVRFLLENSLGAWWATRHPDSPLIKEFEYLRFDEDGQPAAGTFDGWPDRVADVTVMDPCCGSGHFLVEAFGMLWRMRAEEEGLDPVTAQDAVLKGNLFGLELDERCTQIAAFSLALTAWKAGGYRELPVPRVGCSGISAAVPVGQWVELAGDDPRIEDALRRLHRLFGEADTLGSLIDPRAAAETGELWSVDFAKVAPLLDQVLGVVADDPASAVFGQAVAGAARAAGLLAGAYTLVATNVPYLSRTKQGRALRKIGDASFPLSKHDLATMMLERLTSMSAGEVAVVLPQGWTQLSRYEALRERILESTTLHSVAFLGNGAFSSISGEVVNVILLILSKKRPTSNASWTSLNVIGQHGADNKALELQRSRLTEHNQSDTRSNPDARIVPEVLASGPLLKKYASSLYGLRTGDGARLIRYFWELPEVTPRWRFHQSTVQRTRPFAGREHILLWDDGSGALSKLAEEGIASIQGEGAWGRLGVVVSLMGELPVTRYTGESFDNNCAVVWPRRSEDLPALWAYVSDPSFSESVRRIDRSLKVTNQTLLKVPFDAEYWRRVAERVGALPQPSSDDPTQWLFDGRPEASMEPLQVAVSRLVGYRWPEHGGVDELDELADRDGIVCLPAVAREQPAAERLQTLLARAYGGEWTPGRVRDLVEQAGSRKKNLSDWLREEFFKQHCRVFANRPFVWHVWDGRKDGFSALVNYHRLDRAGLEKLTYTYLGDWIERQRADAVEGVAGADVRLAAARDLKGKLEAILEGEPPYDIYVRWKELHEQPVGWEPDLDDGVRLNIRPFAEAGVLRAKVNVHWKTDRGKNPDGSERRNELHYTVAEKRRAREKAGLA